MKDHALGLHGVDRLLHVLVVVDDSSSSVSGTMQDGNVPQNGKDGKRGGRNRSSSTSSGCCAIATVFAGIGMVGPYYGHYDESMMMFSQMDTTT